MYRKLIDKEKKLAVIGLGYVGLPVALAFARKLKVIGFDINEARVEMMRRGADPSKELPADAFAECDITFTSDIEVLREAHFFIVAVPTPVDEHNFPDLQPLKRACEIAGKALKRGDYVVFESTVYPGCTEEVCIPLLEEMSGLRFKDDFKAGYSPERINPGDKAHTLSSIIKVVSGCCDESRDVIASVYSLVVSAGIFKASSIKVAEAAKIIENTQRDLNIALMNELSVIFDKMGINTYDVLEAAGTKWNFLKFQPGLVGGHCIGVDPYYLTYKSRELGYESQVILAGRAINDSMGAHVARKVLEHITAANGIIKDACVLILGATFKENVSDIRNSKVADVVRELVRFSLNVDVMDPHADNGQVMHEYGFSLVEKPARQYDAVIVAVPHDSFKNMTDEDFAALTKSTALVADLKGVFRDRIKSRKYWTL